MGGEEGTRQRQRTELEDRGGETAGWRAYG